MTDVEKSNYEMHYYFNIAALFGAVVLLIVLAVFAHENRCLKKEAIERGEAKYVAHEWSAPTFEWIEKGE